MGTIRTPREADLPETADVVVIGGGIVGVATAFWTSRAGLDTVLVEKQEGLGTQTTSASAECFRAQFTEPAMVALAKPSIEIFDNFADVIGVPGYDIHVRHRGYLFMTDDAEMLDDMQAAVARQHELGVTDSRFLEGAVVRERFPFVADDVVGATFRQNDGWLAAHELVQGFAKGSDAEFLLNTTVSDVLTDTDGVSGVETTRGTIATRAVVDAAGPFAGRVGKMVGVDLPLEPVRRQKVFVAASPEVIPQEAPFTVDLVNGAYWRPETGGALLGWVDPEEPVGEPVEIEALPADRYFPAVVLDKLTRLNPFFEEVTQGLKQTDVSTTAGQYVYTPDEQPLIGRLPEVPGLYVNCGYWAGVMLGPTAGRWTADLITGEMQPEDNPLRPTRFAEGDYEKGGSFLSGH
ncbi:MAG: 4-methylaminobutanoate oxidase (formaldehyde-forming) [Anaerolineales bacterium]|nr:4-methylaminobutanoate oxidase (formaldehyde-forming) [Anaerolineales bacterium]